MARTERRAVPLQQVSLLLSDCMYIHSLCDEVAHFTTSMDRARELPGKITHTQISFIKMHKGRLITYNASRANKINIV